MVAPWFAMTPRADTTRMLTSALFAPKAALQNFWRNKGLSIFAVSVMFVVLMMTGISLVLAHSFNQSIDSLKGKASTISIFISDTTPLVNVINLENRLSVDPRVKSVSFVDKSSALSKYKQDPSIPPDMIANLEGYNLLPASLDVDVKDIKDLDAIATAARGLPLLANT